MGVSLLAGNAIAQQPQPKKQAPPVTVKKKSSSSAEVPDLKRDIVFNLLEEAYATSGDLQPDRRIRVLSRICQTASELTQRSPGMLLVGSAEIRGRVDNRRVGVALTKKQLQLLKDWSNELFRLGTDFPADSRERHEAAFGAMRSMAAVDVERAFEMLQSTDTGSGVAAGGSTVLIFNAYYQKKGLKAIPEIQQQASQLGDRGSYPYEAVATLLTGMKGHPEIVRQFFNDAMTYYRRGTNTVHESYGMLRLLTAKQIRTQLEGWQVQAAAQLLADQMTAYVQNQRDLQLQGKPTAPGGQFVVRSVKSGLKQFAPEIAATIPDAPTFIPSSFPTGPQTSRPHPAPPDETLTTLRATFEERRAAVMELNENEIHEGPQMQQTIDSAVDLGAEVTMRMLATYPPQDHNYAMRMASASITDVVQVGTRVNPAATLGAIRRIQDDELKAELLITVASTLQFLR